MTWFSGLNIPSIIKMKVPFSSISGHLFKIQNP